MALGLADRQGDLLDDVARFCDEVLPESSIYAVLYRERDRLFPDEMFADLFSDRGRRSVPPSVLVDMRARLAKSDDPRRIFQVTLEAASAAGLVGAKRVLDSTPLYDAVATMDTITLIRSAV